MLARPGNLNASVQWPTGSVPFRTPSFFCLRCKELIDGTCHYRRFAGTSQARNAGRKTMSPIRAEPMVLQAIAPKTC